MRQYQKGEVMLVVMVVMVVMLVVAWLWNGQTGMMGHGADHSEKPGSAEQQAKAEQPPLAAPKDSHEP